MIQQRVEQLVAGDRMSRDEFMRRWESTENLKRAELIGGVVYMPAPVSAEHDEANVDLIYLVKHYARRTPGCSAGSNATWLMLEDAPQPDAHLRLLPECGGQSRIEGGYYQGAPEFAAEVCRSRTSYDLHQKLELYHVAGVKEYLAILLSQGEARWHQLAGRGYRVSRMPPSGIFRSRVFPGLWFGAKALLEGDMERAMEILTRGLDSKEHAHFVAQLAGRKREGR